MKYPVAEPRGISPTLRIFFIEKDGFGIEQRFESGTFEDITLFWSPERIQINLEMIPTVKSLKTGGKAKYVFEVHYLDKAPVSL